MSNKLKNILIPTNFSENSRHALKAAVTFAQKIKGQIFLYHRSNLPPNWDAATDEQKRFNTLAIKRDEELKGQFTDMLSSFQDTGISIQPLHSEGDLLQNTEDLIEDYKIDMVVMGSEGARGFKEWYSGSNAEMLSETLKVPVLIIKKDFEEFPLKQVVFASEFEEDAKKPFLELIELLRNFESTINLLYICSIKDFVVSQEILDKMEAFKDLCSALPCTIHTRAGHSVESGIQFFIKNIRADLLSLVHHPKGSFEKLIKGSNSDKLINHLECPVLSIPADEKAVEIKRS